MTSVRQLLNQILVKFTQMKPLYFFSLIMMLSVLSHGQNRELVTTRGFNNMAWGTDSLPGNQWVFVTISSPAEGAIYQDTITLWICDSTGKITNRITSLPPIQNEIYLLNHLITLPDTSILLQYGGGDCDACCYAQVLEKWNIDGSLDWQKIEMEDPGETIFSATPDHRLFAQKGYHVVELDWDTGDTLWQNQYTGQYLTGLFFIPGTADFIVYGEDEFSRYDLDTTGSLQYHLTATLAFDDIVYDPKIKNKDIFFTRRGYPTPKLFRFNTDLTSFTEFDISPHVTDFTPVENGVILLTRPTTTQYNLTFKNQLGVDTLLYTNSISELIPYRLQSNLKGLALVGQYTAGPRNANASVSTQGWFRYFPFDSLSQHSQHFSVSISKINQRSAVVEDSTYYDNWQLTGFLHTIQGGDFEMEVTNTGDQPVDSFWINARFQSAWFVWFCGLDMCKNVLYHAHLDPGESKWLDFGDIYAFNQFSLPKQYCFWTSGPSGRPDDLPLDDTKCVDRTVGSEDPPKSSLAIYPQPASNEFFISGLIELNEKIMVTIYSIEGKIRKTELIEAGQESYRVNIADLPNGYYAVKIGEIVKPLVIVN